MLIVIAVIVVLILLNGLFVAAEFAIAGVPRSAIERRAARGERVAKLVLRTVKEPQSQDRYIATAQLGITLATIGLGMYGEHHLAVWVYDNIPADGAAGWLGSHLAASIIAIALITYFHIVVGEMVPKALALQNAERTAIAITPVMLWLTRAMFPFVVVLNAAGNLLLRLMGVRREASSEQYYTPEELRFIVRETSERGDLDTEAAQIIAELFEFGELNAADIMVPRIHVKGLELGISREQLTATIAGAAHTRYPVYEEDLDHIVGMVHIKDLLRVIEANRTLRGTDVRPIEFIPETSRLDTVLNAMSRTRAQMVAVLDEYGGVAGVVTIEDVFEEVVGHIDETGSAALQPEGPDRALVAGILRLAELGGHWGIEIEHDDVETVGGLVLALLDREPKVGDSVTYGRVRLEVLSLAGHAAASCRAHLLPAGG